MACADNEDPPFPKGAITLDALRRWSRERDHAAADRVGLNLPSALACEDVVARGSRTATVSASSVMLRGSPLAGGLPPTLITCSPI